MDMSILNEFLPTITKYGNIEIDRLKIEVEKFNGKVVLNIICENPQVGDMLTDMMVIVAKLGQSEKDKLIVELTDHRGDNDD